MAASRGVGKETPAGAAERDAVRTAGDDWGEVDYDPTWKTIVLPEVEKPPVGETVAVLNTDTGTDHDIYGTKDPFRPSMHGYHRERVTTSVVKRGRRYEYHDSASPLVDAVRGLDGPVRTYRADVTVRLVRGEAVAIPSPAPDAVVTGWVGLGDLEPRFVKDPGDGLRIVSKRSGDFRLRYTTLTRTDYLGAPLPAVPTGDLRLRPLGFFRCPLLLTDRRQLSVFPDDTRSSHPLVARFLRPGLDASERERAKAVRGAGTDFAELREYRLPDSIRRVDWKATARRCRLMVREYEEIVAGLLLAEVMSR